MSSAEGELPPDGRVGRAPRCPYKLDDAGRAWWRWAWRQPQATQWDSGSHYQLARRAQLEDSLAALDHFDPRSLDALFEWLFESLELPPDDAERLQETLRQVGVVVARLKALAGNRLSVLREMRELDDRFGLDPRAMAALKWTIGSGEQEKGDGVDSILKSRHLRVAGTPA